MRELSWPLRLYLLVIYAACAVVVAAHVWLAAVVASQAPLRDRELYKRLFNICHPTLAVGLSAFILSAFVAPAEALAGGWGQQAVYAAILLAAYYVLDVGVLLGVLALMEHRGPLAVWRTTYRQTALPELATSSIGILGAVTWRHNPILLVLVLIPTLSLRAAFDAIAGAEDARRVAREAQERAEEALRMRDDFMNAASHDLRTPLTGVIGRADLMQMRLDSGAPLDEEWLRTQMGTLRQSARRMAGTVDEITDAAQLQMGRTLSLKRESVDVAEMVKGVAAIVAAASPGQGGAPIEVDATPGVVVEGDRRRLERVVQNVVGNAVKYSPEGTPIDVGVRQREGWAVITVRDHGVGIPADELPRIFTRFYRASTSKGIAGTGIGLAGSKTIVEQHGGQITIESIVGEGTTVTVLLPREQA